MINPVLDRPLEGDTLDSAPDIGQGEYPKGEEAIRLAHQHGLVQIGIRPSLRNYLKDLWSRHSFTWSLASARAYSQNQGSYLGQAWAILDPTLQAMWFVILFGVIFARDEYNNAIGFITIGIFTFRLFQQSIMSGSNVMRNQQNLMRSHAFPRAVVPLSDVLTNSILYVRGLIVMVIITFLSGFAARFEAVPISWRWLGAIPAVILCIMFAAGLSFIFARIGARTPDVAGVMPFVLNVVMFASGAAFSFNALLPVVGERGMRILQMLPTSVLIYVMRSSLLNEPDIPTSALMWALAVFWAIATLLFGFVFFWRGEEHYGQE